MGKKSSTNHLRLQGTASVATTASRSRKDMIVSRVLQLVLWSLGTMVVAAAYVDPRFRDAEGVLGGGFCLPVAVGVALMVLGCAVATRLQKFACWFGLALVGQAVALQMVDAGHWIRYQHYKPWGRLITETHPLLLLYLAGQAGFVVAGFRARWRIIRTWLGCTFKVWQLAGIGTVLFLLSATVSRELPVYVAELLFATFVQSVNLGNIILLAWALPEEALASVKQKCERLLGQPGTGDAGEAVGIDRLAVLSAVWVTGLAVLLSFFCYERHPHVPDEVGYLYHARYFAAGMLTMPTPPAPDALNIDLMTYEANRWYSPVPPGWPMALALGVLFGVPWLVNPLLAGLNILAIYVFLQEIYDRRTARVAMLLLSISPWYVFMGMNFMTHTFTLTCALIAALAVAWARRTRKARWGWLGGFATGMVSLIRPLDGLVMAGLLGLWAAGVGGQRLTASSFAGLVLGSLMVGSAVLPYNYWLTGDPAEFPLNAYFTKYYGPNTNALGFGPERGVGWSIDPFPGHSPIDAFVNANLNIFSVNIELFGWSIGSLVFVILLLFSKAIRKSDYLMLAVMAAFFAVYSLYWFSGGPGFGARYWYLILVPCVALTVKGMEFLQTKIEATAAGSTGANMRVIVGVLALCALTLLNYFPWRAIDKYHHYLGMRPDIRYLAQEYGFGKSLVLIRGERHPDYASAAIYNPLDLHADMPVYAWDRTPEVRAQALSAYPDRPVWLVDGPTITRGAFKVIEGPILPHERTVQGY
jgi:4-amino-4-deoxy-L-arabinose transferase-like glycosyltransferase